MVSASGSQTIVPVERVVVACPTDLARR